MKRRQLVYKTNYVPIKYNLMTDTLLLRCYYDFYRFTRSQQTTLGESPSTSLESSIQESRGAEKIDLY